MRSFLKMILKIAYVLMISVGAGMLGFASSFKPFLNIASGEIVFSRSGGSPDMLTIVATVKGFGTGLTVLGILGLALMWTKAFDLAALRDLRENTARTITVVAVWLSLALVFTFGVIRPNLTDASNASVSLLIFTVMCLSATVTSAIVYGWKPFQNNATISQDEDERKSEGSRS